MSNGMELDVTCLGEIVYDDLFTNLDILLEKGVLQNRNITLIGPKESTTQTEEYLYAHGLEVANVMDDYAKRVSVIDLEGKNELTESWLKYFDESNLFLLSSKFAAELIYQLESYGYQLGKNIFVIEKRVGRKTWYDTSKEAFSFYAKQIKAGFEVYSQLKEQYPFLREDSYSKLLIFPYNTHGDLYVSGNFLDEYLEKNNIRQYLVTVTGQSKLEIAEGIFGWSPVKVLTYEQSCALVAYVKFVGYEKVKAFCVEIAFQKTNRRCADARFIGYRGLDYCKLFQSLTFHLPIREKINCKQSDVEWGEVEAYAESIEMKKGKTAILALAGTVRSGNDLLNTIARMCQEHGYEVYVNGSDTPEHHVDGVKYFLPQFQYIQKLVEYAGLFVGIRSGLCDIIASVNARKYIIYPDKPFGVNNVPFFEVFSLEKFGFSEDVVELVIKNV